MPPTLLTANQVQDLLGVDASTVYRMAGDGRLPAVRVGRQWRFHAASIDALLGAPSIDSGATETAVPTRRPAPTALPSALMTAVLEAVAPALGVSMVVTDLEGEAATPVVNPAPAIAARRDDPSFTAACTAEWRAFAGDADLAPRLRLGGFGFLCAHSLVRHRASLVAMVLAGGIAPDGVDDPDLFHLDAPRRELVLETLPRTAALLSRMVAECHLADGHPDEEHA